jgi:ABC-type ATPase involved in cell division
MEISVKINEQFKSIAPCEFTLPLFCVLTGKNGSGKSHLLEAIEKNKPVAVYENGRHISKHISIVRVNDNDCQIIRRIEFGKLNPDINEQCDPNEIREFVKQSYQMIRDNRNILRQQPGGNDPHVNFLRYVGKSLNTTTEISETDLFHYFDPKFLGQDDFLAGKFALLFKNYHRLQEENQYNQYRKKEKGYTGTVWTDEEFIQKYGIPPWELVNDIFKRVEIPYRVNDPLNDDRDATFNLCLEDIGNIGVQIKCNDLSTGEKVLMSLAMAIYNSDTDSQKPDILLIDEPDAGLHPSMSKNLIDIIKEFIVGKSGIPVIITTHSATTIAALDDDDAIYEKERSSDSKDCSIPQPVEKERALSILTSDIPFLTVSMEKRRAVFVESEYDAKIYAKLYEIFKDHIQTEPHFFPFRAKKSDGSNCDDVREQVKNFANCGDSQVYGIVDYDINRSSNGRLIVLGEGAEVRYAIENYVLDPLLVGLFLIYIGKKQFSDFNVTTKNSHFDIPNIEQTEAQNIINAILVLLGKDLEEKKNYNLYNGWILQTADSIFTQQGHNLEALYKEKISCLGIYNNEASSEKNLKLQIIEKIIKDVRGLLPKPILDTLMKIH